jgi:GNAT superfamily N-acetyltransferase
LIIDLFVHPAYQGEGVGSKLLEALIKRASEENIVELHGSTGRKNAKALKSKTKTSVRKSKQ